LIGQFHLSFFDLGCKSTDFQGNKVHFSRDNS